MQSSVQLEPKEWVSLYADELYGYALVRVNDVSQAEDLVQETFLSALRGSHTFRGEASERSWLFSILKNKIVDYYRSKRQAADDSIELADTDGAFFRPSGAWKRTSLPKEWDARAEQPLETKEFYLIIEQCRDRLQQLQQMVFACKYLDDLDSSEICRLLNITQSNYWVLLHRVRLHMRECIERKWLK
jgi:RNA polymerase sigma-70 factor (TIGR02943 family)